jgi:hypothetical protein
MQTRNLSRNVAAIFIGMAAALSLPLVHAESGATDDRWQFHGALYLWGADLDGKAQGGDRISVQGKRINPA